MNYFIERVSLSVSRHRKLAASMTLEAAIVLPLFLFFFLNLGCAMEMIRLHGNLQLALTDIGNRMSVYGYAVYGVSEKTGSAESAAESTRSLWAEMADLAFTYTYVKSELADLAGEAYLEASPLENGVQSLQFLGSDVMVSGGILDVILTYRVEAPAELPGISLTMANRYYGHLWVGYDVSGETNQTADTEDVVYLTKNASVYHESLECTHLKLTVRSIAASEVSSQRNQNGGRYTACEKCAKGTAPGTLYISPEGDCYHYRQDCSGLKRTIYTVPRSEATGYRPCSRCAGD